MKVWYAIELEIARVAEAPISASLWTAGTTGIEISEDSNEVITLRAWFDAQPNEIAIREQIERSLAIAKLPPAALRKLQSMEIADQDWLAEWKKGYEPVAVGERLLISPSWKRDEVRESNRVIVEIDPGMAFGTGTHETTRGCLELLERYWRGGSLLDVGTGTGILAISAAKLVPGSQVIGFDVDPEAIVVAEENAQINGVDDEIVLEVNRLASFDGQQFDLVVANLTADVLIPLAEGFSKVVGPDSVLIVSGILTEQGQDVIDALGEHGFEMIESKPDGEWVTLAAKQAASA
ncbi:MAG: 50S ribosomal protein L11 methyltransferase [Acidobacteriota bacterium]